MEIADVQLKCTSCSMRKQFSLSAEQARQIAQGEQLEFRCGYCAAHKTWVAAESADHVSQNSSAWR